MMQIKNISPKVMPLASKMSKLIKVTCFINDIYTLDTFYKLLHMYLINVSTPEASIYKKC